MPSMSYLKRREGTVANLLAPEESTFTNVINVDKTLVYKGRLSKPTYIIRFSKNVAYTVWDDRVIKEYLNEKCRTVSMVPHLDFVFNLNQRDTVVDRECHRGYYYHDLITQKKFRKEMEFLKPKK